MVRQCALHRKHARHRMDTLARPTSRTLSMGIHRIYQHMYRDIIIYVARNFTAYIVHVRAPVTPSRNYRARAHPLQSHSDSLAYRCRCTVARNSHRSKYAWAHTGRQQTGREQGNKEGGVRHSNERSRKEVRRFKKRDCFRPE
eukprot:6183436-Pleurochrysis_carterae.AAC.2